MDRTLKAGLYCARGSKFNNLLRWKHGFDTTCSRDNKDYKAHKSDREERIGATVTCWWIFTDQMNKSQGVPPSFEILLTSQITF